MQTETSNIVILESESLYSKVKLFYLGELQDKIFSLRYKILLVNLLLVWLMSIQY
jgi:hypothetical protein